MSAILEFIQSKIKAYFNRHPLSESSCFNDQKFDDIIRVLQLPAGTYVSGVEAEWADKFLLEDGQLMHAKTNKLGETTTKKVIRDHEIAFVIYDVYNSVGMKEGCRYIKDHYHGIPNFLCDQLFQALHYEYRKDEQVRKLKEEVEALKQENGQLKQNQNDMEQERVQLRKKVEDLQQLERDYQTLQQSQGQFQQERERLIQTHDAELRRLRETSQLEHELQQRQLEDVQKRVSENERDLIDLKQQLCYMNEQVQLERGQVNALIAMALEVLSKLQESGLDDPERIRQDLHLASNIAQWAQARLQQQTPTSH